MSKPTNTAVVKRRCTACPGALHTEDKCPFPDPVEQKRLDQLRRSFGGDTKMNVHLRVGGVLV